jgi:hypothetical protein
VGPFEKYKNTNFYESLVEFLFFKIDNCSMYYPKIVLERIHPSNQSIIIFGILLQLLKSKQCWLCFSFLCIKVCFMIINK